MSDVETTARDMGWIPKEDFRGDPEKWVDAETFVKRGEEFIPFLKANNRKLNEELESTKDTVQTLEARLAEATETLNELKKFNTEVARREAEKLRGQLLRELKEAKDDGDVEKEEQIRDKLDETREALKKSEDAPKGDEPPANPEAVKVWQEWVGDNPWFKTDTRRRALAVGIGEELRNSPEGKKLQMREFLDKVAEEVDRTLGGSRRQAPPRVEGGGRSNGGDSGGGDRRSYGDLPADAKAACDRQARTLVGPNKAFKTEAEWRKHYVNTYDWS